MRAQAHTLEAIVASILLLSSVVFALQMTAVTPLSASTSSQHVENQQQAIAEGVLSSAAETGALRRAVLFWNESDTSFHNTTTESYYTRSAPPNDFGDMLEQSFGQTGIAYNVYLYYYTVGEQIREKRMVYRGAPSDNAVTASRTVVLTDDSSLYNHTEQETNVTVNTTNFYAADAEDRTPIYNVIRVEVTVWRI